MAVRSFTLPSRAKAEQSRQLVPPSGLTRAEGAGWRQALRRCLAGRSAGSCATQSPLSAQHISAAARNNCSEGFRGPGTPVSRSGCASARLSLPGETAGPAGAHATAPLRTPPASHPVQAGGLPPLTGSREMEGAREGGRSGRWARGSHPVIRCGYLVDPASSICLSQRLSHARVSTHGRYSETANGSLNQLWFL